VQSREICFNRTNCQWQFGPGGAKEDRYRTYSYANVTISEIMLTMQGVGAIC